MKPKVHFVGIGGSGISGVAHLAAKIGYQVSGCDLEASTAYGAHILQGHDPAHIKNADLVVTSPALFYQTKEIDEISAAKKTGKLLTWQEFVGKILLKNKKLICIAGTHGKSTTTAMAGKLLIDNGFDPIVIVGATVPEWNGNSRFGEGEYAVIEADEFNDNFLNYRPEIAVINNIEFDHPDYFKDEKQVYESFKKFQRNLVGQKIIITQKDNLYKKFNLKVFGKHNQDNANMVFVLGRKLGIPDDKIIKSLESFTGIQRRMELIADRGGVSVYDDYAHHPTAIKTTLDGLRVEFPNARILAIVEPHGFKRTKELLTSYKGVFDSADTVLIGPIFKARDEADPSITSQKVADTSGHKNVFAFNSFEELNEKWKMINDKYNVVVVMGAGKSYLWAREIAELLPLSFSDLTTIRTGGKIKKYVEINNKDDVKGVISIIKKEKLPIFILGGGSDILVSDKDFDGAVIKFTAKNYKLEESVITAEAGMSWDELVKISVSENLQGIECLSGIPGTVGAAPIQNIGAYGQEIKDVFQSLEAYDLKNEKFVSFRKDDLKFAYRESIFKSPKFWQKYLIVSVALKLTKDGKPLTKYDSLNNYLLLNNIHNPSLLETRNAVINIRSTKFEDPKIVGNAGSFFKNPIISKREKVSLEKTYPEIKTYPFETGFKIAAGWLIEAAGWKGRSFKEAGVSKLHALILLNKTGHAPAKDIYELSEKIIADVYKKFEIKLEREVQLINF